MFRRQEDTLTPDPKYPVDLKELGYFIDSNGCIRNIKAPELFFDFFHTNNERHNEVRGEAMRTCQREGVLKRLHSLGINELYLPSLSSTKPNGPHVPILAPPADVLKTRKRVFVIINDDCHQDLGILAYRELQRDGGLNGGSVVNFAKEIVNHSRSDAKMKEKLAKDGAEIEDDEHIPGLIVLNSGQLLYSHKFNKALSIRSWNALPRKSISHDGIVIHPMENRIEGQHTPQEHIKTVFETVIKNPAFVAPDAEVYVVAIENGSEHLLDVLNSDLSYYGDRVTAMAVIHSLMASSQVTNSALKTVLYTRTRQWRVSQSDCTNPNKCIDLPSDYVSEAFEIKKEYDKAIDWLEVTSPHHEEGDRMTTSQPATLSSAPDLNQDTQSETSTQPDDFLEFDAICPTFGGGDTWVGECIFTQPVVQQAILRFFEEVARDPKDYCNPPFNKYNVPLPTPDNPLTFSAPGETVKGPSTFDALPTEMLAPEKQELESAKIDLAAMKTALLATPQNDAELAEGRARLEKRVAKKEVEVSELTKKALASGAQGPGNAQELRKEWEDKSNGEKWTEKKPGYAIPFAGTTADSEVLKSAGCLETVEEELERLELEEK